MSNVTFQLLGQNINFNPQQLLDLGQAAQDLNLIATEIGDLRNPLHALQDGTLVSLALNNISPKWTLPGSPATFSLTPTASFTIKLQSTGPLFKYFTDFDQSDTSTKATIDPAPGKVYLIIEADFGIAGALSGNDSIPAGIGVFKVSGKRLGRCLVYRAILQSLRPCRGRRECRPGSHSGIHPAATQYGSNEPSIRRRPLLRVRR